MNPFPLSLCLAAFAAVAGSQSRVLEYRGRYDCQTGEPDHLMCATTISGDRALVGGNRGIAVVDLKALPVQGTRTYLSRLTGVDARDLYVTADERHVFVNLNRSSGTAAEQAGFAVLRLSGNTLQPVVVREEPKVLYEKMCLVGSWLYVAAHRFGLRIYDISNPESPMLAGSLTNGLDDAIAVAVDGDTAWIADGAGGLKRVDVTNRQSPVLRGGETLATAIGTAEDVLVRDGRVYVAGGGAGLLVYDAGSPASRAAYRVPGFAESLCLLGDDLAVGSIQAATVFALGAGTMARPVAQELAHRRGASAALRFASDVGSYGTAGLLVADWNFMDLYELKDLTQASQPDINANVQRIRFAPSGGKRTVTVWNNGAGPLLVSGVSASTASFQVGWTGGTLAPGEQVAFDITYLGGAMNDGSGVVHIFSDDPDESPLPIQVFGNTSYLDPGEAAPDFTLPTLRRDPTTRDIIAGPTFTLSQHRGKVVWFHVYGSW